MLMNSGHKSFCVNFLLSALSIDVLCPKTALSWGACTILVNCVVVSDAFVVFKAYLSKLVVKIRRNSVANHFDIIIFGGTGDLSYRKLLPALYRSESEGKLSEDVRIFATSRKSEFDTEQFVINAQQKVKEFLSDAEWDEAIWDTFKARLTYLSLDTGNYDERWDYLASQLDQTKKDSIFYFALPASVYGSTCANIAKAGLATENARVILEKPIGYDFASAEEVNAAVAEHFPESNIYRIDHYLGKETVQNLLALRFTNALFEHLWDARSIDHVQITLAETVGLEGRAGFYDGAGAMRDMMQNHLLQLLCLVAMDPPISMDPEMIRSEKVKVLKSLRPILGEDVTKDTVCGQYSAGHLQGKPAPSYLEELRNEKGPDADSKTETYVAIRAHIDNWRWAGVPFYLRTGKRMKARYAEIVIEYKSVSHRVYDRSAGEVAPNRLIIRLQPDETIQLVLNNKVLNSSEMALQPVTLNLELDSEFQRLNSDAYKRLLMDAAEGNPTLFIHREEIQQAWNWIDPIINAWKPVRPKPYDAGSWGPNEADMMIQQDGRLWYYI